MALEINDPRFGETSKTLFDLIVFILAKDILLNRNHKERNQMLYVALTRPKYSAIVLK